MNHPHQSEFSETQSLRSLGGQNFSSDLLDPLICKLPRIPPERIGLNGEYDHAGLAKRVQLSIRQHFGDHMLSRFEISQRGKVVIFRGNLLDQSLISQVTQLALAVDGADFVEVYDDSRIVMRKVA